MTSAVFQLHLDMAHRCVRETFDLVRQGRDEEALKVAELAVEAYDKAIAVGHGELLDTFVALAMRAPHPSENLQRTKRA